MTVPGLHYRPGSYDVEPAWRRWWPLAAHEFLLLFRTKLGVAAFCACLLPLVVYLFVLMVRFGVVDFGAGPRTQWVARSQAMAKWDPLRPDFFVEMVCGTFPGLPIVLLLTATATAGAVARDRRTNALELLWTRGIGPYAYLFAKWLGALLLLGSITVGAPLLLWGGAVLMAEDWTLLQTTLPFLVPMLGGLLLAAAFWSALCVLVSTICATTHQAVVAWCMLVVGSAALGTVLAVVFRTPSIRTWCSVWEAGGTLARYLAGVPSRGSVGTAILFLGGLLAVLAILARRRLALAGAVE